MKIAFLTLPFLITLHIALYSQSFPKPENCAAKVHWDGQNLTMTYNGKVLLQGRLENPESVDYYNVLDDLSGQAVSQVVQVISRKEPLQLTCTVYGSYESFPCEAERKEDAPLMVRHSVGLSHSLLNRAVYDRRFDWLLSADFPTEVEITPEVFVPSASDDRPGIGTNLQVPYRARMHRSFPNRINRNQEWQQVRQPTEHAASSP